MKRFKEIQARAIDKVNGRHGAPMGRCDYGEPPAQGRCYLFRVRLDSGGYDAGGAYWGHGQRIYAVTDSEDTFFATVRADNRQAAADYFTAQWEWIAFYGIRANVTPVFFRLENDGADVLAVFPYEPGTYDPNTCTVYAHMGQHSSADYAGYALRLPAAKPEQYAPLRRELESRGYRLRVLKKAPPVHGRNGISPRAIRASKIQATEGGAA